MAQNWDLFTNHTKVLLCVARNPDIRVREIAAATDLTERGTHRILAQLVTAGYLSKQRHGRRTHYTVARDVPLEPPLPEHRAVGELIDLLLEPESPGQLAKPRNA